MEDEIKGKQLFERGTAAYTQNKYGEVNLILF